MQVTPSPGGLASGLRTYLQSPRCTLQSGYTWVGWPGGSVRTELQPEVSRWCEEKYSARPVFLSSEESHAFYDGFCNQTLWPLFQYFPSQVSYDEHAWSYYERVNHVFCDAVATVAEPGDFVWVHDYHFLLLPALLKRQKPQLRVGFFLH